MKMSPSEMIGIDQQMIPTGKRYEYDEFNLGKQIGATILDNCFTFDQKNNNKFAEVLLESETMRLRFWQRLGVNQFNYVQVFTHPDRHAIALEPMTCNVDAFNNGEGLTVLLPNEKVEVSCGVEVSVV
jgi:aldose 1-epimerase